jgi:hypothetical protein
MNFASDAGPIEGDLAVPQQGGSRPSATLKRAVMAAVTAFMTINIWTGAPLLALWVGSRVVGRGTLSMAAVGVVLVVLAVVEFVLAGRPRIEHRPTWLRSMRAEAEVHVGERVGITLLERIVMINVYLAVITLIAWWVFFAGPPTPLL